MKHEVCEAMRGDVGQMKVAKSGASGQDMIIIVGTDWASADDE